MVETYGYDSPTTNQGPLRRTLAFEATLSGSEHSRDRRRTLCGPTRRRCHRLTILWLVREVPSPAQHLKSLMELRGAGYCQCVDQWGINTTVVPHLANEWKLLTSTVSKLINGVQEGGVRDHYLIYVLSNGVSYVRVKFSYLFKFI